MKTVWGLAPVITKTTHTDKKTRDNFKIKYEILSSKKPHKSPRSHHKNAKCTFFSTTICL